MTDTAGLRETLDPIEAEGVAVAQETAQHADMVLSVQDCVTWLDTKHNKTESLAEPQPDSFESVALAHANAITVLNKADALTPLQLEQLQQLLQQQQPSAQHSPTANAQGKQAGHESWPKQHLQQHQEQPQQQPQQRLQQHQQQPVQQSQQNHSQQSTVDASLLSAESDIQSTAAAAASAAPSAAVSAAASAPAALEADQVPGDTSMRSVMCSCQTGWNMQVLVNALEQGVQGIMQSGQEAEEALVITRFCLLSAANSPLQFGHCTHHPNTPPRTLSGCPSNL